MEKSSHRELFKPECEDEWKNSVRIFSHENKTKSFYPRRELKLKYRYLYSILFAILLLFFQGAKRDEDDILWMYMDNLLTSPCCLFRNEKVFYSIFFSTLSRRRLTHLQTSSS